MKKRIQVEVEFTGEEISALLIAEVVKSCGPAPEGTEYTCDHGYRTMYDVTVISSAITEAPTAPPEDVQ